MSDQLKPRPRWQIAATVLACWFMALMCALTGAVAFSIIGFVVGWVYVWVWWTYPKYRAALDRYNKAAR